MPFVAEDRKVTAERDLIAHGKACQAAKTRLELEAVSIRFFYARGLRQMSYYHVSPLGVEPDGESVPIYTYGFPEAWVKRYIEEKLYEVDPVPRHSKACTRPFRWLDLVGSPELSNSERKFMQLVQDEGLGNGWAIPVFGPHGRNGYCGLSYGPKAETPMNDEVILLSLACHQFHWRYCELHPLSTESAGLSKREAQTLRLLARGLSNAQVAKIMEISPSTVDTNVRRCFQKLGVNDRVSAVLRGIVEGVYD
ncbi:MAG: LuxR family transcriptional regulator [Hyphomonadaceae bacterium]|nr:LuxR family transcriptional regulator [Hyphomonadaceae bacterium]